MKIVVTFIRDCGHFGRFASPDKGFHNWAEQEAEHELALANPCTECPNDSPAKSYRRSKQAEYGNQEWDTEDF